MRLTHELQRRLEAVMELTYSIELDPRAEERAYLLGVESALRVALSTPALIPIMKVADEAAFRDALGAIAPGSGVPEAANYVNAELIDLGDIPAADADPTTNFLYGRLGIWEWLEYGRRR